MANKVTKAQLNKHLQSLEKEDLIKEIGKLYTKFSDVKMFYQLELSDDTSVVVEEYKKKLKAEYFPSRGTGKGRSSVSRKVINDFKKISVFKEDVIELLLYRVALMLNYMGQHYYIDEAFNKSVVTSFEEACKLIHAEQLQKSYLEACEKYLSATKAFFWLYEDFNDIIEEYLK